VLIKSGRKFVIKTNLSRGKSVSNATGGLRKVRGVGCVSTKVANTLHIDYCTSLFVGGEFPFENKYM